jgi:exopolyphosphatase/guanosine-5'-triphosphate,3'-diphosphate pyrophosphatase
MAPVKRRDVVGAIDIGTNAARLLVSEVRPNGALHVLRAQRDAIRPGEGVFKTGKIAPKVAGRIVSTLKDFAHTCRGLDAQVRAVATSSFRDAANGEDVRQQVLEATGIDIEIISGDEEARLICAAVLERVPPKSRGLVIDIGGGSTEVTLARAGAILSLNSLSIGTVRLTELFDANEKVESARLNEMRAFARMAIEKTFNREGWAPPNVIYGSSGTVRSLAAFMAPKKSRTVTLPRVTRELETLAAMSAKERRKHFEPSRADVIVSGAVVLESLMDRLELAQVTSVDRGLRDGILMDLLARRRDSDQRPLRAASNA